MILSAALPGPVALPLACVALAAYALAAWPGERLGRLGARMFGLGIAGHAALLAMEIGGAGPGSVRLGFGPVLSLTVCAVLLVHAFESRLLPLPGVRRALAALGALAVVLELTFPGEPRTLGTGWASLHWLLGVGSYGLFGAAVLHGLLLDSAERRLRQRKGLTGPFGLPLLQLERLTFRFVQAGFGVLTAAIALGALTTAHWRWDHKTVLLILSWVIFALLLAGRHWRGWRGQQATRWLYAGVIVLQLAYVGSRFVLEVLLERGA
ncbi:MAG: inner membrane protein YpjD [Rubrivivax sp.]